MSPVPERVPFCVHYAHQHKFPYLSPMVPLFSFGRIIGSLGRRKIRGIRFQKLSVAAETKTSESHCLEGRMTMREGREGERERERDVSGR